MERPAELSAKKARKIKNIVMKLLFFLNKVMRLSRSAANARAEGPLPLLFSGFRMFAQTLQWLANRRTVTIIPQTAP